jgi:hypothetical protein
MTPSHLPGVLATRRDPGWRQRPGPPQTAVAPASSLPRPAPRSAALAPGEVLEAWHGPVVRAVGGQVRSRVPPGEPWIRRVRWLERSSGDHRPPTADPRTPDRGPAGRRCATTGRSGVHDQRAATVAEPATLGRGVAVRTSHGRVLFLGGHHGGGIDGEMTTLRRSPGTTVSEGPGPGLMSRSSHPRHRRQRAQGRHRIPLVTSCTSVTRPRLDERPAAMCDALPRC